MAKTCEGQVDIHTGRPVPQYPHARTLAARKNRPYRRDARALRAQSRANRAPRAATAIVQDQYGRERTGAPVKARLANNSRAGPPDRRRKLGPPDRAGAQARIDALPKQPNTTNNYHALATHIHTRKIVDSFAPDLTNYIYRSYSTHSPNRSSFKFSNTRTLRQ